MLRSSGVANRRFISKVLFFSVGVKIKININDKARVYDNCTFRFLL